MTDDIMPEFWRLLAAAQQASEAVDVFDLRSEDTASTAKFNSLVHAQNRAALALLAYLTKHGRVVKRRLESFRR